MFRTVKKVATTFWLLQVLVGLMEGFWLRYRCWLPRLKKTRGHQRKLLITFAYFLLYHQLSHIIHIGPKPPPPDFHLFQWLKNRPPPPPKKKEKKTKQHETKTKQTKQNHHNLNLHKKLWHWIFFTTKSGTCTSPIFQRPRCSGCLLHFRWQSGHHAQHLRWWHCQDHQWRLPERRRIWAGRICIAIFFRFNPRTAC